MIQMAGKPEEKKVNEKEKKIDENNQKEKTRLEKQNSLNKKKLDREKERFNGKKEITAEEQYFQQQKLEQINAMIGENTAALDELERKSFDIVDSYKNNKERLSAEGKDLEIDYEDFMEQVRLDAESMDDIELKMWIGNKDLADSVIQNLNKMYDSKLADYQNKNNKIINQNYSEVSSKVGDCLTGKGQYASVKSDILFQMKNIEQNYGGNKLGKDAQSHWTDKYRSLLNALEASEKAQKSGSGKDSTESFVAFVKADAKNMAGYVLEGKISYEKCKSLLESIVAENYQKSEKWKETKGKTPEERKKLRMLHL